MSEGLCWKCAMDWKARYHNVEIIPLYAHCHHEPKERPKCWCDDIKAKTTIVEAFGAEWEERIAIKVNFCPQCGRKL